MSLVGELTESHHYPGVDRKRRDSGFTKHREARRVVFLEVTLNDVMSCLGRQCWAL